MGRLLKGSLLLLAVLLLVTLGGVLTLFMARNAQWVVIRVPLLNMSWSKPLSVMEYETPLALVMVACCVVGVLITVLAFLPASLRRAVERRRERRFIGDLEEELGDLRNLPVTSPAPLEDEDLDPEADEEWAAQDRRDEDSLMAALQGEDLEPGSGREGRR